jgi:hypothetical protein
MTIVDQPLTEDEYLSLSELADVAAESETGQRGRDYLRKLAAKCSAAPGRLTSDDYTELATLAKTAADAAQRPSRFADLNRLAGKCDAHARRHRGRC